MAPPAAERDFRGTERFEVLRRIGQGGKGVVYAVRDRETGAALALKTVRRLDGHAVLQIKNEFRVLRDLYHRNLVRLGELIEEGGRFFFTMELVDGPDFLAHVRSAPPADERPAGFDERRLRVALRELAEGLAALHETGRVHRDVKPSNVLVAVEGRVVILDFGLATTLAEAERAGESGAGTLQYAAPEQLAPGPVGPEADWYAVGVMLHEALTGQHPVPGGGTRTEYVAKKHLFEPRPLGEGIPEDLDRLRVDLLQRDPQARPPGREVLRRLGAAESAHAREAAPEAPEPARAFVGRGRELAALEGALGEVRRGAPVTAYVFGESGVGKSALVARFADRLAARDPRVLVLAGRCFERESIPYRGVDGVVDALSGFLAAHEEEARALVPPGAALLAEVFPVLGRVRAVRAARDALAPALDPQERRSTLRAAIRELFARLAERRPVVIAIDDLQWSDAESLALLREILRPPDAPALLLIATVRTGTRDAADHGKSEGPQPALERWSFPGEACHISLAPLPVAEARELAALLLGVAVGRGADAAALAAEAGGHPLFLDTLCREAREAGDVGAGPRRLDDALWARVCRLEALPRRALEVVAIAGAPIVQDAAALAAEAPPADFAAALSVLRASNLVRMSGVRGTDAVEPFHDRVRESVLAHLGADARKSLHERLAKALASSETNFEALFRHWRDAGDRVRAAEYAALAAAQAARVLAFDRAATLYRAALELGGLPTELEARLGDALANAGRGPEAADAYRAAARRAASGEAFDLRRRAAEQLLRAGKFEDGMAALGEVLGAVGLGLAKTPGRALARGLARRAWLRLRGLGFREREAALIAPAELARVDACWSAAMGLAALDATHGVDLQTLHLRLALRVGEPFRVARALALEAGFVACGGPRAAARTAAILASAEALARRLGHPYARAWVAGMAGCAALLEGRFRDGREALVRALAMFREQCTGVAWELATIALYRNWSLHHLGEIGELARIVPLGVREAEERGDLYTANTCRTLLASFVCLAADDPAWAAEEADLATRLLTRRGFHLQNVWDLIARTHIALYLGEGTRARRELLPSWPDLERSLFLRVQYNQVLLLELRGRTALAAAAEAGGGAREKLLGEVERIARRSERERVGYAEAHARMLRSSAAWLRGERDAAADLFGDAAARYDAAGMALYAAVARRRRGVLVGGDEGRALVAAADAWMRGQNIVNPARMAAMLAPDVPT
jgi:hypothetical protein